MTSKRPIHRPVHRPVQRSLASYRLLSGFLALAFALGLLLGPAASAGAADHDSEHDQAGDHEDHRMVYAYKIAGLSGGFLGIQPIDLTPELRRHYGVSEDAGVLVGKVVPDSPAFAAGLQVGDIVTSVGGEVVDSPGDVRRLLGDHEAGDTVTVQVWRNGSPLDLTATLTEREGLDIGPHVFDFKGLESLEGLEGFEGLEGLEALKALEGLEDLEGLKVMPRIHLEDFDPGDFDFDFHAEGFDPEAMEELEERLQELFNSDEWHATVRGFEEHQGDLQQRLQELEERLHELEGELEELGDEPR
ncbi:MAG: PDZ domain-containing protein [Acidobacteriota bacterium]|nr:PDZ domain-containing protein [Acidobacteriota bacterium]